MLDGVSFVPRSGIGVFWPWGGPAVEDPNARPPVYLPDPYLYNGTWVPRANRRVRDGRRVTAIIKDAGFDHVRWQVNPGPWLDAYERNDMARLEYMDQLLDEAIAHCFANDLGVMMAPFYTGFAGLTDRIPMQGITTPGYLALRQLMVHWADRYKNLNPARFALEMFNEPPSPGFYPASWEYETQPDLYLACRAAAPDLTMVVTCAEYSAPERFVVWDLTNAPYDDNTIYSFHPLRPAVSVLQGFIYNQYQYVNMEYPPNPAERAAVEADMQRRVNSDPKLGPSEKANIIAGLLNDLNFHFSIPQDLQWMRGVCDQIADWADSNGIARSRLHAGEYGMTRDNIGYPGIAVSGYTGGRRNSRIHMYRDWTTALFELGCRRSPIHLDTNDYGMTFGQDDKVDIFDPLILQAVAPLRYAMRN